MRVVPAPRSAPRTYLGAILDTFETLGFQANEDPVAISATGSSVGSRRDGQV
jgi:hypothetical protein